MNQNARRHVDRQSYGSVFGDSRPSAANDDHAARGTAAAEDGFSRPLPKGEGASTVPEREAMRLAELHALELLDTPRDPTFDRIVDLANRIVGGTMAAISLVDTDRQWFKAKLGLGITETPRDIAFCRHTVEKDDVFVVEDAVSDGRFRDNPLVAGAPGLRAYAGAPVRGPGGEAIGTLCVLDTEPRHFGPNQKLLLRLLADLVEDAVRLHATRREADAATKTSARQRAALDLRSRQLAQAEEVAALGIFTFDVMSEVAFFSRAVQDILGGVERPLTFSRFLELFDDDDRRRIAELSRGTGSNLTLEREIPGGDGARRWVRLAVERHARVGDRPRLVGTVCDITEERRRAEQIAYLERHDAVTGLLNRTAFEAALEPLVESANDANRTVLALVSVDVVEDVRERAGQKGVDTLLTLTAERFRQVLRQDDLLARVGEASFGVAIEGLGAGDDAGAVPARLLEALGTDFDIAGSRMAVHGRVGFAVTPDDVSNAADFLRAADAALGEAARANGRKVVRFDPAILEDRQRHRSLIDSVRAGLARGELAAFLQPKVHLATGAVVGFEALLRWHHPERGLLGPSAFLPALEHAELGALLSDVTMERTIALAARFAEAGFPDLVFSINLNTAQLERPHLVDDIARLCRVDGVPPSRLMFEVVESVLIRDRPQVAANLATLSARGYGISLDDFGTGHASLTNIREPFIREIKIDRSFVMGASSAPQDRQIVGAIVNMARAMELSVVAEGVETAAHVEMLLSLGCEIGQGFHFAAPLEEAEALAYIATDRGARQARGAA